MITLIIIVCLILFIIGVLGSFLPVLPGPPISFVAFLLFHFFGIYNFSVLELIIWGILALLIIVLDFYLPIWTTKKFGGTKYGQWGATIGVIAGIFLGGIGIVIGPFIGAFVGELLGGMDHKGSLKSAFGAFVGFLVGTGGKLIYTITAFIFGLKIIFQFYFGN
jgi:uncharacterized protein YqgC (DUF456 family)